VSEWEQDIDPTQIHSMLGKPVACNTGTSPMRYKTYQHSDLTDDKSKGSHRRFVLLTIAAKEDTKYTNKRV